MNTSNIIKRLLLGALCATYLTSTAYAAAPVLNLIRPTNGASYAVGSLILVRATATASNAILASLDFMAGTNVIRHFSGPLTNGLYTFPWTNAPAGIHQVHAEALDDTGDQGVSASAQITVTNVPVSTVPVVTLIQPTNNAVFQPGTPISLTASATDSDGTISFVEFFSNTENLGQVNGPSTNGLYNWVWTNTPAGMFQLRAEAVDNDGNRGVSALVQVNVTGVTNNAIPVVALTNPTNSAVFALGTPILLRASASDSDGTLTNIDLIAGTNLVRRFSATLTNGIYSANWSNAPIGTHLLRALARDNVGALGTSAPVQITVTDTNTPVTNDCLISISPTGRVHSSNSETGMINVSVPLGCYWTYINTNPWISTLLIVGPSDGALQYTVAANPSPFSRTGIILISGLPYIITQSGTGSPTNNAPPLVAWSQPTNGAVFTVGTPILLRASASDSDGTLTNIDFLGNTAVLRRFSGTLTNGIYTFNWTNVGIGTYSLRAIALDNTGAAGQSVPVQIVVIGTNAPPTNNALPVITWINPTNSSFALGTPILLTANASDSDGSLTNIDFIAGTNLLRRFSGTLTNGIYNFNWSNAPAGTHLLRALARDNAGALGTSAPVQIVVSGTNVPPATNVWPIITWIYPTNGAAFATGTPILLRVSVSDSDGAVTNLDILDYTHILRRFSGPLTNGIYTFNWTNAGAGSHELRAIALDNNGAPGQSVPVQIMVGGGGGGMVDLGIVQPSTIGHAFFDPNIAPPYIMPRSVVDFLVDQDQSSGGGALAGVSVNWDTNSHFKLTVAAPNGMKFLVNVPAGRHVKFGGFLWWESTQGGFSVPGDVTATFTDLEGTAPMFDESDADLSDSHGYFGFIDLESSSVSNNFAFTSITLNGTVPPIYTGNGTKNYLPHLESSLRLSYSTPETNDPGGFVAIIPAGPRPMIRMLSSSPVSGVVLLVSGHPGVTYIVECSPDTVTWTAISSGVMPRLGSMIVTDASATALDSRFYRVVELP